MTVETVAIPKPIPIDTTVDRPSRTITKERIKEELLLSSLLYLLPPVLDYIGKRYPLRDRVAGWVNSKLEKHNLEPVQALSKIVKPENLGDLPDFLDNMPNTSKLKFMISFGGPQIRKFRRERKSKK